MLRYNYGYNKLTNILPGVVDGMELVVVFVRLVTGGDGVIALLTWLWTSRMARMSRRPTEMLMTKLKLLVVSNTRA